jgi:hypothetical protein
MAGLLHTDRISCLCGCVETSLHAAPPLADAVGGVALLVHLCERFLELFGFTFMNLSFSACVTSNSGGQGSSHMGPNHAGLPAAGPTGVNVLAAIFSDFTDPCDVPSVCERLCRRTCTFLATSIVLG